MSWVGLEFDTNSRQELHVILKSVVRGTIVVGILQDQAEVQSSGDRSRYPNFSVGNPIVELVDLRQSVECLPDFGAVLELVFKAVSKAQCDIV